MTDDDTHHNPRAPSPTPRAPGRRRTAALRSGHAPPRRARRCARVWRTNATPRSRPPATLRWACGGSSSATSSRCSWRSPRRRWRSRSSCCSASIGPSSHGTELPISRVITLAEHKQIATATLLDHDDRVEIALKTPTAGTRIRRDLGGDELDLRACAPARHGAARILGRLSGLGRADAGVLQALDACGCGRDRRSAVGQGAARRSSCSS